MAIKWTFQIKVGLLLIFILTACQASQRTDGLPARKMSVPVGHYNTVLRFPDGEIWIQSGRFDTFKFDTSRYYQLDTGQILEISLPDDSRCWLTEYTSPTVLPDGRLGLDKVCRSYWTERPIGRQDAKFVVAYDRETGEIEQIVTEPLSESGGDVSWNPEMTRGVGSIGSLLSTIYWVTPIGMEPMTITVGTGERSWSLDENLVVMNNYSLNDSHEVGIARNAVWSPDGRFIAFWASTDVIGRTGHARARGSYSLYLLDPETLDLKQIVTGVRSIARIVWSPNSQWLIFVGDIGSTKRSLWLISVDGDILQFIDQGIDPDFRAFNGWNWLDEQTFIATKCLDKDCAQADIIEYDLSEIIISD